ncbi:hypothetical protein Tco_1062799 [Tanacetum coccineum]
MKSSSSSSEEKESQQVNASDFENKSLQEDFEDYTGADPQTFRERLLLYLDGHDKIIDERVIQYRELQMKEREVKVIRLIKKRLNEQKMQTQECLVTEGIALKDNLVVKESIDDSVPSSKQLDESNTLGTLMQNCFVQI